MSDMVEPEGWMTVPEVAELLGQRIASVHRALREGTMLGARHDNVIRIPTELVTRDERVAKHIAGVITLLRDAGLSPQASLEWLYTPDDTLNGTPAKALHGPKAREVKRRAQGL
ncbi:MAG: DNA-binding protein [Corynebacteriales bacterium]|nr:DNA-binding protein [Mycobacteriales bacterium]